MPWGTCRGVAQIPLALTRTTHPSLATAEGGGDTLGFSDNVNILLRTVLFPDPPASVLRHGDHAGSCEGRGAQ
jgi:hypothetical protein